MLRAMNATVRQGVPLRPDPVAVATRGRRSLTRALLASARALSQPDKNPHRIVEGEWAHDDGARLVLRGATTPTSTADIALLESIVSATVLGPVGVGAELLRRGLVLSFGRAASISLPAFIASAQHAHFVAEGAPIPMSAFSMGTPVTLEPRTIKAAWAMTNEMIAAPNAEALTGEAMTRSVGLALDRYLFGSDPGDDIAPAGLRSYVLASGASADTEIKTAMLADIKTLLTATAAIGGDVTLIANDTRARMIPSYAGGAPLPAPVLGTTELAPDILIAVRTDALAVAISPMTEAEAGKGVTLHMDTAPLPIASPGSPPSVAAPVASVFQTDSTAFRLKLGAAWAMRDARGVAWLTTTW
jgi:hypothetical protein